MQMAKNYVFSQHPAVSPASNNFPTSFTSSLGKQIKPTFFDGMNIQSFFVAKADNYQTAQPYRSNKKKQTYPDTTQTTLEGGYKQISNATATAPPSRTQLQEYQ